MNRILLRLFSSYLPSSPRSVGSCPSMRNRLRISYLKTGQFCFTCQKVDGTFFSCPKCNLIQFCSSQCQTTQGSCHKSICKKIKKYQTQLKFQEQDLNSLGIFLEEGHEIRMFQDFLIIFEELRQGLNFINILHSVSRI